MTIIGSRPGALTAVKFTTVYRDGQNCPKTETACACRSLHGKFTIISDPEIIGQERTDTGNLVRAGAARTLWGLSIPTAHEALWRHLTTEVLGEDERVVSEGNRIIPAISPDALVVVIGPDVPRTRWKSDTWDLIGRANLVVINDYAPRAVVGGIASIQGEVSGRTKAPVVVQDVALPLDRWADGTLAGLVANLLA